MFAKTYVLATLAAISQAAPAASSEANGLEYLQSRQSNIPNGFFDFFSGTNFTGASTLITVFQGQQPFCQQFQPVITGPVGFKSWAVGSANFTLYTNAACSGTGVLFSDNNKAFNSNKNTNQNGFLSFQAVYNSQ